MHSETSSERSFSGLKILSGDLVFLVDKQGRIRESFCDSPDNCPIGDRKIKNEFWWDVLGEKEQYKVSKLWKSFSASPDKDVYFRSIIREKDLEKSVRVTCRPADGIDSDYFLVFVDYDSLYDKTGQMEAIYKIMESSDYGILLLDRAGNIFYSNHAFLKLTQYARNEIYGHKFQELFLKSISLDQSRKFMEKSMKEGWQGETLLNNKEGIPFDADLSVSPGRDENGLLALLVQVAPGRETEEARNLQLHEQRLKALGEMVSTVAHELNSPLTSVVGYADLLVSTLEEDGGVDEEVLDDVKLINSEAKRALEIIRNLLIFAGKKEPAFEILNLNELVEKAITHFKDKGYSDQLKISFIGGPDLPGFRGDKYMLMQVLVNLIQNAKHALLELGRPGKIRITTGFEKKHLVLEVSDNGPGIPQMLLEKIFSPFFTTKKAGQGTGIGLSLVQRIVQDHKGKIRAQNNRQGGASFIIELPALEKKKALKETGKKTAPNLKDEVLAKTSVLVVDDESGIRKLAAKLPQLGIGQVDTAENGAAGLEKMSKKRYDMVITDINMPVLDGISFFRKASADEKLKDVPFVFITGNFIEPQLQEFIESNGVRIITKPFSLMDLIGLIREFALKGPTFRK